MNGQTIATTSSQLKQKKELFTREGIPPLDNSIFLSQEN